MENSGRKNRNFAILKPRPSNPGLRLARREIFVFQIKPIPRIFAEDVA